MNEPISFRASISPNYEARAMEFLYSVLCHKVPLKLYLVGYFDTPRHLAVHNCKPVNYGVVESRTSKFVIQHGAFTAFENEPDDRIIAFIDADAKFQRPFTQEELDLMRPEPGEFILGRNKPDLNQTLADESLMLNHDLQAQPRSSPEELEQSYPGSSIMVCRNTGFCVARNEDWKGLYEELNDLWKDFDPRFLNPAKIQWLQCYVIQKYFKLGRELPLTIHAHGHYSPPSGVHKQNGVWMVDDKVIAYAHNMPC